MSQELISELNSSAPRSTKLPRSRWTRQRTEGLSPTRCELRKSHSNRPLSRVFFYELKRIDEFVFRIIRRNSRSRGLLFYQVLELAIGHNPVRHGDVAAGQKPRAVLPTLPQTQGQPPSLNRPLLDRPWSVADLRHSC